MKKSNKKTLIEKKKQKKALFYKYCYVRSTALWGVQ